MTDDSITIENSKDWQDFETARSNGYGGTFDEWKVRRDGESDHHTGLSGVVTRLKFSAYAETPPPYAYASKDFTPVRYADLRDILHAHEAAETLAEMVKAFLQAEMASRMPGGCSVAYVDECREELRGAYTRFTLIAAS